jgi:hypothetical protein
MLTLLKKAGYKATEAKKINDLLKSRNITTVAELENAPVTVGLKILTHDVYSLISAVVQAANAPEPAEKEAPDTAESVKETDDGQDN